MATKVDVRAVALLQQLAAWNRNPNGSGAELGEICAAAEMMVGPQGLGGPRHGTDEIDGLLAAAKDAREEIASLRSAMFATYAAAANGAGLGDLRRRIEAERDAYESHFSLPQLDAAISGRALSTNEGGR